MSRNQKGTYSLSGILDVAKFDNTQAYTEGWALFDDGEIQRLDEPSATGIEGLPDDPMFESDTQAVNFVMGKAREGSEYHRQALELHLRGI